MMGAPMLPPDDIIVFAFRYALGRCSTAPSTVVEYLMSNWSDIGAHTRKLIVAEVREALDADRAGMPCDRRTWADLLYHADTATPRSTQP